MSKCVPEVPYLQSGNSIWINMSQILQFSRAERDGIWDLHISSFSRML
jgi:hypothetical protein